MLRLWPAHARQHRYLPCRHCAERPKKNTKLLWLLQAKWHPALERLLLLLLLLLLLTLPKHSVSKGAARGGDGRASKGGARWRMQRRNAPLCRRQHKDQVFDWRMGVCICMCVCACGCGWGGKGGQALYEAYAWRRDGGPVWLRTWQFNQPKWDGEGQGMCAVANAAAPV
jgi:hypothetical protein